MDGMKGDISIREASCRWGVSERRVNQYCVKDVFPAHPVSGGPGQFRRMRKSRPPRVKQIPIK